MTIRSSHSVRHRLRLAVRRVLPRALPDFLILGAQRSGTSALHHLLAQHHEIRPPIRKEINFFTKYFHLGTGWYRAHFPILLSSARKQWLTFESTPYYLYHPLSPARANAVVPNAKLIAILRNPIDRAFSQYKLNVFRGRETREFEKAIALEEFEQASASLGIAQGQSPEDPVHDHFSYLSRGLYARQLQAWIDVFGSTRLLVVCFEEYRENPMQTVNGVLDFLDLGPISGIELSTRGFEATRGESIPQALRSRLFYYFDEPNQDLFRLTGRTFPWS